MGGYFICNGIERIIRMLIQQRRHYIMALRRGAYHKRGKDYTDCATLIRSGSLAACVYLHASNIQTYARVHQQDTNSTCFLAQQWYSRCSTTSGM